MDAGFCHAFQKGLGFGIMSGRPIQRSAGGAAQTSRSHRFSIEVLPVCAGPLVLWFFRSQGRSADQPIDQPARKGNQP